VKMPMRARFVAISSSPTKRVFVVAAGIAATFAAISPVSAQSETTAVAQAGATAKVRVAHFSPDAPAVDVYFDGVKRLTNVQYEKHSNYLDLSAGKHKIEVRPTGAAADVPPVISAEPDLAANSSYTLAAIGKLDSIAGNLYADDTTSPGAGKVKLRVIHAAPELAPVDVVVKGGAELAAKLEFPNASPYLSLTPGKYDVEVRTAGQTAPLLASTVVLQDGGVYTISAIGGADKKAKLKGLIDLQPSGAASPTTPAAADAPESTVSADAPETTVATETTAAAVETTVPTETTVAVETTAVPETTAPETSVAPDTTVAPETTAAPDTTLAPEATPPAGGVASGFGGLSNGSAVGATALAAAAGTALVLAAQRRRATR
jgi:hypothetical protein